MAVEQLQTFLEAFSNSHHTTRTVVVCPNGETFQFGQSDNREPLMLYIKNLEMIQMCTRNYIEGLESSYLHGYWDCNNIPGLLSLPFNQQSRRRRSPTYLKKYLHNPLSAKNIKNFPQDAQRIESLNLEFNAAWLDPSLSATIAHFKSGKKDPLYIAQQRRLQTLLKILQQRHALSILETNACWGAFTEKACLHHDLTLTTLSQQHAEFCKNRLQNIPFPINYQIKTDKLNPHAYNQFDAIVSMLPQLSTKSECQQFFKYINTHLKKHGIACLQLVTDATIPHHTIGKLMLKMGFRILEHQTINRDAAKTYRYWLNNFSANFSQLEKMGFSKPFLRQWKYHLSAIAHYFSTEHLQARDYVIEKISE